MKAVDVMSRNVTTVTPESSIVEIAQVMLGRHISAVPVVDGSGALVGIVSEGDLIRRHEIATVKHPSWWLQLLVDPDDQARDYVKSHGRKAADVMTAKVISVRPDTALDEVATLLERHHIKRVPVVDDGGKIAGIVSRADLIRGLAAHPATLPTPSGDDDSLREAVMAAIRDETGVRTEFINVIVSGGTVHLWGGTDSENEKRAVRIAAESIAGADKVVDNVSVLPFLRNAAMWAE